ncbi:hypothetical protein TRFO_08072 [Tritrichomonas foetus]|uniref:Uncharacterized protein n=1 Tax=Tritrichomonas foetus TaxID=1144522 RepID=A0A1J4JRF6_9EUKA|nr:hypothetical protein TRFO_08072 [Tritrichomonas foetus]|eukprot:OHT00100.1 hypothetical protein TRFO_08072 [Tritrichomonas foetus]
MHEFSEQQVTSNVDDPSYEIQDVQLDQSAPGSSSLFPLSSSDDADRDEENSVDKYYLKVAAANPLDVPAGKIDKFLKSKTRRRY